ncbi:MAG: protein kinase [Proteobacteria bacterium]|nr:protein kinase [Pseudomonadota bacterium]
MTIRSGSFSFPFTEAEMPIRYGRYMLLKRRNVDAVGEEFLAAWGVDDGVDQLRIIHGIYPELASESQFVALFSEEARTLSRLASANVVRVIEVGSVADIPFVATEYVEGVSLGRLLTIARDRDQKCLWELAAYVSAELLRGLDYVHHREDILGKPMGMRHGDVRPANVIISYEGEVKLTNFSSTLYLIADDKMNARFQEFRSDYASPESKTADEATVADDLWGVSAILAELVGSRKAPDTNNKWWSDRRRTDCQEAPNELYLLLRRALNMDNSSRFMSAVSMRNALLEILQTHGSGHHQDDLASWVCDLGEADRKQDEAFIRKMITKDAIWSVDNTPETGQKLGPGTKLDGRYRLHRVLGEGGMGHVFEAQHTGIGRKVAIKVLHERILDDDVAVERFRREAQITGSLGHPNIVEVFDSGVTSEGHHYLVMELLQGEPMSDRMEAGAVSHLELAGIMARVCDGLDAAHKAGVIHRDLKPDNVFLTETGPKIVDFGIARRSDLEEKEQGLTKSGFICGTAEYLAPEQVRGQEPDHRTDIYAAGVMIYEGLTARTPFIGKTVGDTLQKVMSGKLIPPRKATNDQSIPKELEKICLRAMARDPNKRYVSAAEMATALRGMLFSLNADEASEHSWEKTQEISLRYRITIALVVILSVVAVAAITLVGFKIWNEVRDEKKISQSVPGEMAEEHNGVGQQAADKKVARQPRKRTAMRKINDRQPTTPRKVRAKNNEDARIKVEALVADGNGALGRLDIKEAARLFGAAKQIDSTVPEVWYGLGKVAIQQDRYTEAIKNIQYALKLSPRKRRWRIYLGQVFMTNGDLDRAVEEGLKVLEKHPGDQDVLKLLEKAGAKVETTTRGATSL